jgi:hypothetical protein
VTLRCHACKKPLLRYAVSNIGADGVEYGWGPKCGQALVVRKKREVKAEVPWRRGTTKVPARDPHTRDWINEVMA